MISGETAQGGRVRRIIGNVVILIAIAVCFYSGCEYVKHTKQKEANYAALQDSVAYYKNRTASQTASIKTLQLEKSELQAVILDKDAELAALSSEFARVKSVIKYKTVTQFDTIRIAYKDTVPCVFERSGKVTADWYSFRFRSDQHGIALDTFKTWTTATAITGVKRKWFLGRETITTDITNSNPHITVTDILSAETVMPAPWYKKWYVWFAAGIAGGIFIAK